MFYYIWANDCEYCKQVTTPIIEKMMLEGLEINRIEQDSIEHQVLLKRHKNLPNVTPFFFNNESGFYLRGASYATYYNLKKIHQGGQVVDYETLMYYGENIKGLPLNVGGKIQESDGGVSIKKPTTLTMARELAKTAWDSIKAKGQGDDVLADKVKAKIRWDICQECSFLDKSINRCRACGCFMKLKVHIDKVQCPEKKW